MKNYTYYLLMIMIGIGVLLISTTALAGSWDEHLVVQTILNESAIGSNVGLLDNEIALFCIGFAQHEAYDLLVNERPLRLDQLYLLITRMFNPGSDSPEVHLSKDDQISLILSVTGVGISTLTAIKRSAGDPVGLRKRLFGFLGALGPDIFEGVRLSIKGMDTWTKGGANAFHFKPAANWEFGIDTFTEPEIDNERRIFLQFVPLYYWQ